MHHRKVEIIKIPRNERTSLLEKLSKNQGQMPQQERNHWVKNWKENSHQISQIKEASSVYQEALNPNDFKIDSQYKSIIAHFELTSLNQKKLSPNVYYVKKQIDLSQTVDVLMANPKET